MGTQSHKTSSQPQSGDPSEHDFLFDVCQKCGVSAFNLDEGEPCFAQPPCSEQPQEWTQAYVCELAAKSNPEQAIADAHKAELRELTVDHWRYIEEQRQQLAAEREKRKQAEHSFQLESKVSWSAQAEREQLRQQLLQAQAAIAEHNRKHLPKLRIGLDLSALDKHDAEVRKPLVEALKAIVNSGQLRYDLEKLGSDALAKVKK